ncbi:D12 class N6 adenine-specific DNA methyltransferase (plasmid) [Allomeiothermus silvanus DSM 9946]|uniref:site-specific DNA-methyltransferase (adenine-specific) n=1 Tax=Allomeiothermus silvanus (strain ATCC 700542 / DSM 9946 / NBRC 106475 / NCIMB 13440 / VI-R2) TaxID=526227 RepID=D7BJT0_ALLS1|nr:DNA adenine methylase [Allomeiothermus silvanus]ADH65436.1 D12 class N6 adenine-specific DNA methyltransferase [Allomeiothermus silvanus DSM 9946]
MGNAPEYKPINSPIKWVGGKSRLRKKIISLLPSHTCYVEVFGGAAWVLFGKPPSDVEVLNDIDGELINFFRVLRTRPEEFLASFEFELVSREEFQRLANLNPKQLSEIERAHRFYYLIMAGWGGELNYPRFQTSITDGGHGNRLIGALKYLKGRIRPVHERLKTVIIENLDWKECIERYDRPETVFYVDPPYPGNGVNYFHNMWGWEDHQELADRLIKAQGKWVLSSYDDPWVREMYKGFHVLSVQAYSGMRTKKDANSRVLNEEVLVMNFHLPAEALEKYGMAELFSEAP